MSIWIPTLTVLAAGAVGGLLNAYFSDNGFAWPRVERVDRVTITRPGFLGSMLVGGVAAVVSWGLYGPFAAAPLFGSGVAAPLPPFTLSSLVGALLVGVGGGRFLTDQVDKFLLRTTAVKAAEGHADAVASRQIATASPADALEIARGLSGPNDQP